MNFIPGTSPQAFPNPLVAGGLSTQPEPSHQILRSKLSLGPRRAVLDVAFDQITDVTSTFHPQLGGSGIRPSQQFRRDSDG